MTIRNRIKGSLATDSVVMESEEDYPPLPAKTPMVSDGDTRRACDVFGVAVSAMNRPGKVLAPVLGIKEPHLSEMKSGARSVTLDRLCGWAETNPVFLITLARELIKPIKGACIVVRRPVDKNRLREQLVIEVDRNPTLRRIALADAASSLGIDEKEAAQVWDEPTGEIKVG